MKNFFPLCILSHFFFFQPKMLQKKKFMVIFGKHIKKKRKRNQKKNQIFFFLPSMQNTRAKPKTAIKTNQHCQENESQER